MSDKVVFDHVIRAMFTANVPKLSSAGLERVKAAGIDPTRKLLPAYPATTWARSATVLARELHPDADEVEATRRIARRTVDAFAEEFIGRAMFSLLKLLSSDRIAKRMTQNFRSGSNFVDTRLTRVSDAPVVNELWINDVTGLPGFYLGLLEGGLAHTSRETWAISLLASDGREATYRMTRGS